MLYTGFEEDKRLVQVVPSARQVAYEKHGIILFHSFHCKYFYPEANGGMEQNRNPFLIRQSWTHASGQKQQQRVG